MLDTGVPVTGNTVNIKVIHCTILIYHKKLSNKSVYKVIIK